MRGGPAGWNSQCRHARESGHPEPQPARGRSDARPACARRRDPRFRGMTGVPTSEFCLFRDFSQHFQPPARRSHRKPLKTLDPRPELALPGDEFARLAGNSPIRLREGRQSTPRPEMSLQPLENARSAPGTARAPAAFRPRALWATLSVKRERKRMEKRRLGRTDLRIAPMVLGGNVFGWTADKATSFKVLDRFAAAGLNAIDTADAYSSWAPGNKGGESETIIGEWMKARGNRSRMIVVTKVGSPMGKGKEGLSAALCRGGGRGVAKTPADPHDRPLPVALAGHGDARLPTRSGPTRGSSRRARSAGAGPRTSRSRCSRPQSRRLRRAAAHATRRCSRNTIWSIGARSTAVLPKYAGARRSASSLIAAWRGAFSRANTARRTT